tara:strand:+ start:272 stop:457 length:186 start_codon:yes stop_codon:yes gene_type:complete
MKKSAVLSVLIMLAGMTLFSSCGPSCKECIMDSGLGVNVPMGELCDEKLEEAEKMPNVKCE